MTCITCGKKRLERLKLKNRENSAEMDRRMAAPAEVLQPVLEARFSMCLSCEFFKAGNCQLLHGPELGDYARLAGSVCLHPEVPRW